MWPIVRSGSSQLTAMKSHYDFCLSFVLRPCSKNRRDKFNNVTPFGSHTSSMSQFHAKLGLKELTFPVGCRLFVEFMPLVVRRRNPFFPPPVSFLFVFQDPELVNQISGRTKNQAFPPPTAAHPPHTHTLPFSTGTMSNTIWSK